MYIYSIQTGFFGLCFILCVRKYNNPINVNGFSLSILIALQSNETKEKIYYQCYTDLPFGKGSGRKWKQLILFKGVQRGISCCWILNLVSG